MDHDIVAVMSVAVNVMVGCLAIFGLVFVIFLCINRYGSSGAGVSDHHIETTVNPGYHKFTIVPPKPATAARRQQLPISRSSTSIGPVPQSLLPRYTTQSGTTTPLGNSHACLIPPSRKRFSRHGSKNSVLVQPQYENIPDGNTNNNPPSLKTAAILNKNKSNSVPVIADAAIDDFTYDYPRLGTLVFDHHNHKVQVLDDHDEDKRPQCDEIYIDNRTIQTGPSTNTERPDEVNVTGDCTTVQPYDATTNTSQTSQIMDTDNLQAVVQIDGNTVEMEQYKIYKHKTKSDKVVFTLV